MIGLMQQGEREAKVNRLPTATDGVFGSRLVLGHRSSLPSLVFAANERLIIHFSTNPYAHENAFSRCRSVYVGMRSFTL